MRVLLALLIAFAGLAGCLQSDQPETDTGDEPDVDPNAPPPQTFKPSGEVGQIVAPGTSTRFHYTGHTGAEPNIGITSSGNIFVTAFTETLRSSDGGLTWEMVQKFSMTGTGHGTSDPMLWVDTDTDRIYVNHMYQTTCFNMIWSDDEGGTWTQRDLACTVPLVDHQKVMTSKPGPDPNPQTARLGVAGNYPNVVYTCYNAAVGNQCFASFDGGLTYTQEAITMGDFGGVGPQADCSGVGGHPAASPDGTIVVAAGWNCGPSISFSTDSGLTWTAREGPRDYGVGASIDPDVAFTPDGTMYLMYRGGNHMTYVARTTDLGETWEAVWNITAPGLTSTRFHVMSAGDDGRIAMAYLGTRYQETADEAWDRRPTTAPENATWHLFIVSSEDANSEDPTFTAYQVTPENDPVQKGCSWEGGGGGGPRSCRNMLDFIDSAVHPNGTFYVVYTEGCTYRTDPVCAGNHTNVPETASRDRETAVAALDGWSLYAAKP